MVYFFDIDDQILKWTSYFCFAKIYCYKTTGLQKQKSKIYLWLNILCKTINILQKWYNILLSRYDLFFQFNYPILWGGLFTVGLMLMWWSGCNCLAPLNDSLIRVSLYVGSIMCCWLIWTKSVFNMSIFSQGNTQECLVHVVAVLHLINQNGFKCSAGS